jgi:hypothetical protein
LKLLGEFALWLILRGDNSVRKRILSDVFSPFEEPHFIPSFPDPSLSLTSALGHIFLPYIVKSDDPYTLSPRSIAMFGRLALFYFQVLDTGMSFIGGEIEPYVPVIVYYLLLHSAFSKDKLALYRANDLWNSTSNVTETDFLEYQAECIHFVEKVMPSGFRVADL